MFSHPFFWFYVFFQFQIFIYLTNRIGIRQHEQINEILWTSFFLVAQIIPSVAFCRSWDFQPSTWVSLAWYWKAFSGIVVLWVLALWADHAYWILFRKKPVEFKVTQRRLI